MKKNDNQNASPKRLTNQRNSVGSAVPKTSTGKILKRSNPQLPDKPGVVGRLQEKSDAEKLIHRPAASITSRGGPLKIRQQDGEIYVDGDESSYIQTFGTSDPHLGPRLFLQVCAALPPGFRGDHDYVYSALQGIGPEDALEGLLAAQMVAVSTGAMHFSALATTPGQPSEVVDANVNRASKLFRTFIAQLEALNRHRGKIDHPVVVSSVNVNDGGQAIVGSVQHSGSESTSKDNEEKKVG